VTDQLRTVLADTADDARNYADADAAIAHARRTRTRRLLVTAPLAAVVVAAAAGAVVAWPDRQPRQIPADYPALVTAPSRAPAPLTGPVGRASLVYAPCARDCAPLLVLPDGTQYTLPAPAGDSPTAGYSLSPDGRWLAHPTAAGLAVRDLTSTTERDLPAGGAGSGRLVAWSPGSTRALVVRPAAGTATALDVLDLDTGAHHSATAAGLNPVAVRDDGTVLSWGGPGNRLSVADISSGVPVPGRTVTPDLTSLMRPGEVTSAGSLVLGPDASLAMLTVDAPSAARGPGRAAAMMLVDLTDGHAVSRLDLPADTGADRWQPVALPAGGALLVHVLGDRTEIVRYNDVTGQRTVLTTLRGAAKVLPRGAPG